MSSYKKSSVLDQKHVYSWLVGCTGVSTVEAEASIERGALSEDFDLVLFEKTELACAVGGGSLGSCFILAGRYDMIFSFL